MPEHKLMLYAANGGTLFIAAQEISRQCGKIIVRDPAIPSRNENGVGYRFTPLQLVTQPSIYESALLLEDDMPEDMVPSYEQYSARLGPVEPKRLRGKSKKK